MLSARTANCRSCTPTVLPSSKNRRDCLISQFPADVETAETLSTRSFTFRESDRTVRQMFEVWQDYIAFMALHWPPGGKLSASQLASRSRPFGFSNPPFVGIVHDAATIGEGDAGSCVCVYVCECVLLPHLFCTPVHTFCCMWAHRLVLHRRMVYTGF